MEKENVILLHYKDVLDLIKWQENHLLLGNGFNKSLCVNTSYEDIFNKMIKDNHWIYKDAEIMVKDVKYDLELFIWLLHKSLKDDKGPFLKKYVENKVKYDFMKAAHDIVKDQIKNVYTKDNEWIHILLKKFTNYFTLNYDSLLYLLLLNFKNSNSEQESIVFKSSLKKLLELDKDNDSNSIYDVIKEAREERLREIDDTKESIQTPMKELTKSQFETAIKKYAKNKNKERENEDIKKAINAVWEEEKNIKVLGKIDDGSIQVRLFGDEKDFIFDINKETQNLFFLHGAFHIYTDWKKERKIIQWDGKALYDKLEDILSAEEKDIVCIFQNENKIDNIKKSPYLTKCYNKLSELSGSMVVIGSSLSENDSHIFDQINKSKINILYISTTQRSMSSNYDKVLKLFPNKKVIMFEAESISYQLPEGDD